MPVAQNIIRFQKNFQAQDHDIILATNPKSGTTWIKALLFSVLNRGRYTLSNTPLLDSNPHNLVPFFECTLSSDPPKPDPAESTRSPRLFSTHIPYASLPGRVVSKSRIVYLCRNPLDTVVSSWHFLRSSDRVWQHDSQEYWTVDECAAAFCEGESMAGLFWDHVLGFWRASLESPDKVLFLKYEDLLEDTVSHVKRLAEFLGFPFSEEEESRGVVGQIVEFCSFKNLKELDVNKHGKVMVHNNELRYNIFFRKGEAGNWVNHLSPSMADLVKKVVQERLQGSGLTFNYKN